DNALCTLISTFAHICTYYPFDAQCLSNDRYTRFRRTACSGNPFAPRCAGDAYNDLRVTFCERAVNADNSACPQTPQVTAKVWADSFDTPLSRAVSRDDRGNKFLIARETDLDNIGDRASSDGKGNLNLADATFNGVALGGDRADGVAYFNSGWNNQYSYAGILSGTNLGAPLTDTAGSAKWIGSFKGDSGGRRSPRDFVLNVSFGTGDGAGEIEALVQRNSYVADYHIKGEFDDAGVITGTARLGSFRTNNPNNTSVTYAKGKLTGLIGEEGAIGGFFIFSFGGFVARPPSAEELQSLTQTCADDPFNRLCTVGYESERNAVIEHCIIGDNANDERCDSAKEWQNCIHDPFGGW
ncbi:MAG: hypothetical protein K8953_07830, partial [Proteobacteria bacterium]|nr:hypothetical protein [Pseudomonadota bacterium]